MGEIHKKSISVSHPIRRPARAFDSCRNCMSQHMQVDWKASGLRFERELWRLMSFRDSSMTEDVEDGLNEVGGMGGINARKNDPVVSHPRCCVGVRQPGEEDLH